jgi:hypothetical protein
MLHIIVVFWVMVPYGGVIGYQHFKGSYCLHLQSEVNGTQKGA